MGSKRCSVENHTMVLPNILPKIKYSSLQSLFSTKTWLHVTTISDSLKKGLPYRWVTFKSGTHDHRQRNNQNIIHTLLITNDILNALSFLTSIDPNYSDFQE